MGTQAAVDLERTKPDRAVLRVLLVEDDAVHARLTEMFLQQGEGMICAVDVAADLAQARRRLADAVYDAILLDLGLPDGGGLDVLRAILDEAAQVPVLVLTGSDDEAQATAAVRLGAQDFLVKGRLDRQQLRRSIAYAVERKRLLRLGGEDGILESVLNSILSGVLVLQPASGGDWMVRLANPPCERLFGRPLRDLEGASLASVIDRQLYSEICDILAFAMDEGTARRQELRWVRAGGSMWVWADARRCASGVALTFTDVTPLKAREDELLAARNMAQQALEDKMGILQSLGSKVPGALTRIIQRLDAASEFLVESSDNERIRLDFGAARTEAATLSHDVDALVTLRQSAGFACIGANYLSVLELSPDLSAVLRSDTGGILFLNGAGRETLGIEAHESLEVHSFLEFVPPDYEVLFEDGMTALRSEGTRVPMHLTRRDGHLVDVELVAVDCPPVGIPEWPEDGLVLLTAVDTTRRNRASRRIIAREEQLRKIMDNVADAIVVVDEEGRIETLNRATETAFAVVAREVVGTGVGRLLGPAKDASGRVMSGLETFLLGGHPARVTGWRRHVGVRGNGDSFPIEIAVRDLSLGERRLFIGLIRDISERVTYEENILYMANHDLLTTLANRTRFHEELSRLLDLAAESGQRLGLLFFDLDHFKAINDSFGHLVGDRVLSVFAKRLQAELASRAQLVARLSADEFVAIIEHSGGSGELVTLAEAVCAAVRKPVVIDHHDIRVSCSVGVAEYPSSGPSVEELMRGAEFAARTAKETGRNSVQVYDEALSASLIYRQRLETALAAALDGEEFQVYYQPKINLQTGDLVGAEALLRWFHPDLGLISPVEFIPIAEETGMIRDIGEWVLRRVCRDQAAWIAAGVKVVPVAVNLSAVQFREGTLDASLRAILEEFHLPPSLLELELTESVLVEDVDQAVETLKRLKALGLTIAVDDFGTGYSSFGYLTRFPIDCLKIDRTFVCNIPQNPDDMTVARAIIGMAKNLSLALVAEGVETSEQARFLRDHGCDMAQGYLYSRPVPLDGFRRLLDDGVRRVL